MSMDVTRAMEPKSDQLNADDLIAGPRTIRITGVSVKGGAEQPVWVSFDGDNGKPWKPCKSAVRVLASCYGVDANNWIGKHVTIYNDTTVTWAGMAVGGIRISHAEGLGKPLKLALTKTRGKKGIVTIEPLAVTEPAPKPVDVSEPSVDYHQPDREPDHLFQDARENAALGKEAMRTWWSSKTKDEQNRLKEILPELQEIAAKADKETE